MYRAESRPKCIEGQLRVGSSSNKAWDCPNHHYLPCWLWSLVTRHSPPSCQPDARPFSCPHWALPLSCSPHSQHHPELLSALPRAGIGTAESSCPSPYTRPLSAPMPLSAIQVGLRVWRSGWGWGSGGTGSV